MRQKEPQLRQDATWTHQRRNAQLFSLQRLCVSQESATAAHCEAPVAQNHLEGTKAPVSESQQAESDVKAPIYFSASLESLHHKKERCCQSTFVAFPVALSLVIHPHVVRQLLVQSNRTDLVPPSRASSSAGWLATPSWLCRSKVSSPAGLQIFQAWSASAQIEVSCRSHERR